MKSKEIVELLTIENIEDILTELGAEPQRVGNKIISRTVCHNHEHEGKKKLEFYGDNKLFHCYTSCGTLSIFDLVMQTREVSFKEAIDFICNIAGIVNDSFIGYTEGFKEEVEQDVSDFFNKFKRKPQRKKEDSYFLVLDENILFYYYKIYHNDWIQESISIKTMKKFGIRFDIENNRIIIPHRDISGNLIGVRARHLNKIDVEAGRKYAPIYHKGKILLNHATGLNLYGAFENKEAISTVKSIILMESEKGVMQLDSFNMPFGAALSGSNLSMKQIDLLRELGVTEVILGLDKEFEVSGDNKEKIYIEKVKKSMIDKLNTYFKVSIIWDQHNLLDYKDSPTDKGKEVFEKLFKERIFV